MREDDEDYLRWGIAEEIPRISFKDFDRIDWFQSRARYYFPFCPICGNGDILINVGFGGKDTISCENCGARWHLYFSFFGHQLKWAKLESKADDGRGKELLGKKIMPINWLEMAGRSREIFKRNKKLFG